MASTQRPLPQINKIRTNYWIGSDSGSIRRGRCYRVDSSFQWDYLIILTGSVCYNTPMCDGRHRKQSSTGFWNMRRPAWRHPWERLHRHRRDTDVGVKHNGDTHCWCWCSSHHTGEEHRSRSIVGAILPNPEKCPRRTVMLSEQCRRVQWRHIWRRICSDAWLSVPKDLAE